VPQVVESSVGEPGTLGSRRRTDPLKALANTASAVRDRKVRSPGPAGKIARCAVKAAETMSANGHSLRVFCGANRGGADGEPADDGGV
jgi:hypothetical protein